MRYLSLLLVCALWAPKALSLTLIAIQNQETPVPVNAELGSILQLPGPVKTVTPSQYFVVQSVGADAGAKTDVRTFLLKPIPGAKNEVVTFLLASGKALALRLIPTSGGEKFYDIQNESSARGGRDGKFLTNEMAMMKAMLLDEAGGFAREIFEDDDAPKIATEIDDVEFKVARIYASSNLTGYVFRVKNVSRSLVSLNLSSLAFARPNRAALAQSDRLKLEPCPLLGSPTLACQTAIRMIVRGAKPTQPLLTTFSNPIPPFAKPGMTPGGP